MRVELGDGRSIELVQGDITTQPADAIVNAANASLMGGGGVDGAIRRAGGPAIEAACAEIRQRQGPLETGLAVATPAGRLPARHVIHTVGPIYRGGDEGEGALLARCHEQALAVADGLGAETVAFPAISTGVYGYPVDQAAAVAVAAVAASLPACRRVRTVRFVLFDRPAFDAFAAALAAEFPGR